MQRGDLIFWKGHVAIVRDADTIVHANAHHMATVIENTRDAIARIKAAGSEVTAIKRLAEAAAQAVIATRVPDPKTAECGRLAMHASMQNSRYVAAAPPGAVSSRNAAANSARV